MFALNNASACRTFRFRKRLFVGAGLAGHRLAGWNIGRHGAIPSEILRRDVVDAIRING
nr:hypothetical protein [Sphingomonas sp. CDS-1]